MDDEEKFPWHLGVFDAHCHPTDTMGNVDAIPKMNTAALTIMATRRQDQDLVTDVASRIGNSVASDAHRPGIVIPSFGWHPWFSYQLFDDILMPLDDGGVNDDQKLKHYLQALQPSVNENYLAELPAPLRLSTFLEQTRQRLDQHPHALIGEVGLDKAFRIPRNWLPNEEKNRDSSLTPGGREGRELSPYRVSMDHQRNVLIAQLRIAAEKGRAASVHGVQAHGALFSAIQSMWKGHERKLPSKKLARKLARDREGPDNLYASSGSTEPPRAHHPKPYPPRLCLHSYSGPVDNLKLYFRPEVPIDVYVSYSMLVNFSSDDHTKSENSVKWTPEDRILVESDMHIAGEEMDAQLEAITRKVCRLRGWSLEQGVLQLHANWKRFIFG